MTTLNSWLSQIKGNLLVGGGALVPPDPGTGEGKEKQIKIFKILKENIAFTKL